MRQSIFNVVFLLAFSAPIFCGGVKTKVIEDRAASRMHRTPNSVVPRSLRFNNTPMDETFVRPFRFDQKLLICNAYPSNSPLVVRKNAQEYLADGKHAIKFRECRNIDSPVQSRDKLDLLLPLLELHGTFEIGDLPATDAVLLLILEKRENSSLVQFRSFAFPTTTDSNYSQLAVIDTLQEADPKKKKENEDMYMQIMFRLEDHATGQVVQNVSKRVEQLVFNRVYSVEAGTYDASVFKRRWCSTCKPKQFSNMVVHLQKNQNYVVLRTGDEAHFGETLVVYPDPTPLPPSPNGSCSPVSIIAWLVACAATAVATM